MDQDLELSRSLLNRLDINPKNGEQMDPIMESSKESSHIQEYEDIKNEIMTSQGSPVTCGFLAHKVITRVHSQW